MKTLFDKISIKDIIIKNRLIRSATWEGLGDNEGHINENYIKFYDRLSKGGIGLIITGYSSVFSYDKPSKSITGMYNDSFIPEYQKLTETIHNNNCKVFSQIVLGKDYRNEKDNFSSYGLEDSMKYNYIEEIINAFAQAALRVKEANFDGVQLHCAHGFFLGRTLSPIYNKRTDEYGINKTKFILAVYKAVRKSVGNDFVVGIKINCYDNDLNGATFKDCMNICKELDNNGIDFIEVSGTDFRASKYMNKECIYKEYADKISQEVTCPVAVVALNRTPTVLQDILNSTNIKFFSLCRPTICEPNICNKWANGNMSKAKCISCNNCYIDYSGNKCILNK